MAADPVFVDTSVLVAASVAAHPAHRVAREYVSAMIAAATPLCISPQVCREFLVVLTRQPVAGRAFTVEEALAALDAWRNASSLLEEDLSAVATCLDLIRRHAVRGKQVHDCNIVAVMVAHGIGKLVTRNAQDFARYPEIEVLSVTA